MFQIFLLVLMYLCDNKLAVMLNDTLRKNRRNGQILSYNFWIHSSTSKSPPSGSCQLCEPCALKTLSIQTHQGEPRKFLKMKNQNKQIYELVYSLPMSEELRKQYIDTIDQLTKECGCAMGANFTALSLILITIDCIFFYHFQWNTVLVRIITYVSFILILTLMGKLLGLLVARIKKYRLYKALQTKKH